jgi:hypothetical protein
MATEDMAQVVERRMLGTELEPMRYAFAAVGSVLRVTRLVN